MENGAQTLHDLSEGSDDFAHFLDDGLGDGVHQSGWFLVGAGLLGLACTTSRVLLTGTDSAGGRLEHELNASWVSINFDHGWLTTVRLCGHVASLHSRARLDRSLNPSATPGATSVAAAITTHSAATATAIATTAISGAGRNAKSRHEEDLTK